MEASVHFEAQCRSCIKLSTICAAREITAQEEQDVIAMEVLEGEILEFPKI